MGVVLLSSPHPVPWYRQFPDGIPIWEGWRFLFNTPEGQSYDYLVAFDDLAAPIEPRCPLENTIHVATEPPTYHRYDPAFTRQLGISLTFAPAPEHPRAVRTQPGLNWWLGWDPASGAAAGAMSFRDFEGLFDEAKDRTLSIISSDKTMTPGHELRLGFAMRLKQRLGDRVDFYGRGFSAMPDKLLALGRYRYHIAIENACLGDYFTEKLGDAVIAGCYPIYHGCPNLADYLPEESFLRIDIRDFEEAIAAIETALADDLARTRREALREARRRIMYEHNLFPMLVRTIEAHRRGEYGHTLPAARYGTKLLPYARLCLGQTSRPRGWLRALVSTGRRA
jgi:hypothetical protein